MELKEPNKNSKIKVLGKKIFEQQNEILNKYFILDDEKGEATIDFHYEHLEDMLDQTLGNGKARFFFSEFKDKLSNITMLIPRVYKINYVFSIKDYDGYTIEEVNQIFEDNMNIQYFNSRQTIKRKRNMAIILMVLGILFLLGNIFFSYFSKEWNVPEITQSVLSEILDIAAWVFIWESVTIYFIDRSEVKVKTENFRLRIKNIEFKRPEEYHPVSIADEQKPDVTGKEKKHS